MPSFDSRFQVPPESWRPAYVGRELLTQQAITETIVCPRIMIDDKEFENNLLPSSPDVCFREFP